MSQKWERWSLECIRYIGKMIQLIFLKYTSIIPINIDVNIHMSLG